MPENDPRLALVERFFRGTGDTYGIVVNVATFGIDRLWKRRMVRQIPPGAGRILDLACGSAGRACSATFTRRAAVYPTGQVVGAGRARAHTWRMARTIKCIKLGREAQGLDFPPYPGALGKRIYENVSKEAWQLWLEHQKMLVNENRLNLADKKARDYLAQQMENHFFGSGADVAAGYVPPTQQK